VIPPLPPQCIEVYLDRLPDVHLLAFVLSAAGYYAAGARPRALNSSSPSVCTRWNLSSSETLFDTEYVIAEPSRKVTSRERLVYAGLRETFLMGAFYGSAACFLARNASAAAPLRHMGLGPASPARVPAVGARLLNRPPVGRHQPPVSCRVPDVAPHPGPAWWGGG